MPELPEVETVCRGLALHLPGKKIMQVILRRKDLRLPLPLHMEKILKGRVVQHISRRAKYILLHLDGGHVLIVHLGMSGAMVLKERPPETYRTHDHVALIFKDGTTAIFHDPRRFGLMLLATEKTLPSHKLFSHLGPEPLDKSWGVTQLCAILQSSKAPVKSVIMDQQKLVGVGNIYACEALFLAGVHPTRPANIVTKNEATKLAKAIKQVLNAAIESGGSTLRDYVRSSGDAGYFQHHFKVYGRQKLPCLICKKTILVIRQSGRSTFFCAHCQK